MTIRSRGVILGTFLLYTSIGFLITFFLSITFKTFLFQDLFAQVYNFSLVNFFDLALVYTLLYIVWDVLMLLVFVTLFNIIFAKILNLEVGKIAIITAICLTIGILLFHLIMYLWFAFGDPLGLEGELSLSYILDLYMEYDMSSDSFSGGLSDLLLYKGILFLFDLISVNTSLNFQKDPSLTGYFLLYLLMKGWASNVPFQIAGLPFNFFKYEAWFIYGIYLLFFIPLFYIFIKGCECVTEEELTSLTEKEVKKRKEEVFGKEQKTLGSVRISKTIE